MENKSSSLSAYLITSSLGRSVICLLDEGFTPNAASSQTIFACEAGHRSTLCPSAIDQKICRPKPTNSFFYVFYSSKKSIHQ
ncbi:hypothetical protein V496_02693 [Pseudogymnoascus sp. VKM F-4515 (FW-2607)]|nr:hypothetical protein V496_02693 [Pseudogymnoascus sp. VKM F-4515 (FW-2607)]